MGNQVELLAPAGNYEAFLGAVNAGADAVYLGGERFGARAYADNFTAEEILRALHVAHFYGKKIYLTVNTLLKERELASLLEYLTPFCEAGLDGVIVQDLGALHYMRAWFPELPLHASTQMTVTGVGGAALLKEAGVSRIVPARELSLREVQKIRREAGVEVECFIHGAMCYCYSGQCLFSSILGGRSGNRGRCAQPCRLPYEIWESGRCLAKEGYPLSLKDMCTLDYLPKLIRAGIDSFKIEGRMKRPEYAAGVTAVYRKYIDLYYREGASGYRVEPEDMDRLKNLYIRSEIQNGYYERQSGKEMITLSKPGYETCDEALLREIREAYIREPEKMPVRLTVRVAVDEPLRMKIMQYAGTEDAHCGKRAQTFGNSGNERTEAAVHFTEVTGEIVQPAKNAPLTEADIKKHLTKTGESLLTVVACEIEMKGEGFVPVRALNELRRAAVAAFEAAVRDAGTTSKAGRLAAGENTGVTGAETELPAGDGYKTRIGERNAVGVGNRFRKCMKKNRLSRSMTETMQKNGCPVHVLVSMLDQLRAAVSFGCARIYIESDLFLREREEILTMMRGGKGTENAGSAEQAAGKTQSCACYLALPYILRERDEAYLQRLTQALQAPETCGCVQGFLIRGLEGLSFVRGLFAEHELKEDAYTLVADAGLYCFNGEAAAHLADYVDEITLPYELNAWEAAHLAQTAKESGVPVTLIVYSHIPMMITANCLAKTADACQNAGAGGDAANKEAFCERQIFLKDRKQISFPVVLNCEHCYNVLYNAVPYSLHAAEKERERIGASASRFDFTTETGEDCGKILRGTYVFSDYTAGHCKRGVE